MQLWKPFVLAAFFSFAACGSSGGDVVISGDEVRLSTSQLDITFARKNAIAETYMIFGGIDMDRPDSPSKITIVGLGMEHARPIYEDYPDFTMCRSGGAEAARRATWQMDMVPANGTVLDVLQDALAQHNANLQSGGGRVCVAITGAMLVWTSAKIEGGEEVLHQLPAAIRRDLVLVETARIVPATTALAGP